MEKWPVGIDGGHGGRANGCTRPDAPWTEADFNMSLARELKGAIKWGEIPFTPVLLRTRNDETVSLTERGRRSREAGCELVLNIHVNAHRTDTSLHGGLLFHWPHNRLGEAVGNQIARCLPSTLYRSRPWSLAATDLPTPDDDWYERPRAVMSPHACTTVLIEVGFMSNARDLAELQKREIWQGLVFAMLSGLCEFARYRLA